MVNITLNALSVQLGQRTVVRSVSVTMRAGEFIGIIGPNGAGKSTLVRATLGLAPLSGGSVEIDGKPLPLLAPRQIARRIAYLPQGQTLHWPLTVERLVALGRLPHLAPMSRISEDDHRIIAEAMERADVMALRDRVATHLSGGERARVLLARALAVGAAGLIADEPLAALDPGHQIDVMELLTREARSGAMVVAVLHDLSMAARYCDRLLLIDDGRLVADGSPADVLTAERLRTVYGISARIEKQDGAPLVIVPMERVRNEEAPPC